MSLLEMGMKSKGEMIKSRKALMISAKHFVFLISLNLRLPMKVLLVPFCSGGYKLMKYPSQVPFLGGIQFYNPSVI
jgi:hypothetical protein